MNKQWIVGKDKGVGKMGGKQNRVMEDKYDQNALYTYMKLP